MKSHDQSKIAVSVSGAFIEIEPFGAVESDAIELSKLILTQRFYEKPATLIAFQYESYSQPELDQGVLLGFHRTICGSWRPKIRAVHLEKCSLDLLNRLTTAWDFQIRELWLLGLEGPIDESLSEVIASFGSMRSPFPTIEMIEANDDGLKIRWWNPSIGLNAICQSLEMFASEKDASFEWMSVAHRS